jgi:hypothetical protein
VYIGSRGHPRKLLRKPQTHIRPLRLRRPYLVDILRTSNLRLVSQILCRVLARRHLALDAHRVYRLWSVALCQVLRVSDGIRRAWSAVASRQKGVAVGGPTVNQVVANNWTVLPNGTPVREVSGVETVW